MSESDCMKTKGGEIAVIYNYNGGSIFPIHGAIWDKQCKCWNPTQWQVDGLASSYRPCDNLVLTSWQDHIPWKCLRNEIKWVAEDPDGIWFGFFQKPKLEELGWESDYPYYDLTCIEMPERSEDWQNSLAKRPERV